MNILKTFQSKSLSQLSLLRDFAQSSSKKHEETISSMLQSTDLECKFVMKGIQSFERFIKYFFKVFSKTKTLIPFFL